MQKVLHNNSATTTIKTLSWSQQQTTANKGKQRIC